MHSWGLFNQNISINQIVQPSYILCWAAKWHGEKTMHFASVPKDGRKGMIKKMHKLLDEADVVVHYNGSSFDIKTLNKEFLEMRLAPPSPYLQVDLLRVVKSKFRFPSNKLQYVAKFLNIGEKVKHSGHELWTACMEGHKPSWIEMEKYNKQDVNLLIDLYAELLPWITNHPNPQIFELDALGDVPKLIKCPTCSSKKLQARGKLVTKTNVYHRFQCTGCGSWSRSNYTKTDSKKEILRGA